MFGVCIYTFVHDYILNIKTLFRNVSTSFWEEDIKNKLRGRLLIRGFGPVSIGCCQQILFYQFENISIYLHKRWLIHIYFFQTDESFSIQIPSTNSKNQTHRHIRFNMNEYNSLQECPSPSIPFNIGMKIFLF